MHEIIGPLVAARARGDVAALLRFTRMTGELVKAMRACPQPIDRGGRRGLRGRRRHPGHGQRPALRHGAQPGRVPVRAGRPVGRRHGRLRHPAAHHRAGARQRAALHRPGDGRRRGRAGASSTGWSSPTTCWSRRSSWPAALANGPTVAHATTKRCLHVEWDMSRRRRHRDRSQGAGRVHGDRGLRPRLSRLRRQDAGRLRRELTWPTSPTCTGRSSTDAHRGWSATCAAGVTRELKLQDEADPSAACRAYVAQLGRAGWLRYAVPAAYGGAQASLDVRSLCLIRETLGYASGLAEFAFAMQGLGSGPISLFGSEPLKRKYLPAVGRRLRHRGVGDLRGRGRVGPRGDADHRPPRRRVDRHQRREDLDLERRHRRLLRGVLPLARGRRAELRGRDGRCRHPGPDG